MAKVAFITLYDESCLGARSLAAYLEREGHECHIIHFKSFTVPLIRYEDAEAWKIVEQSKAKTIPAFFPEGARFISFPTPITGREREILVEKLDEIGPDAIAFSLLSTHLHLARELTALCRERFPKVPVLWGGVHAIAATEDCFPDADVVSTGEGEIPMAEYLADPKRRDIRGLWFRDRETGEITKNPMARLIEDLDSLPFPQWGKNEWMIEGDRITEEAMDQIYVKGHYRILTGRNCPFRCAFCVHSTTRDMMKGLGTYCRRRSVDNVLEEIMDARKRFGIGSVLFADEIFMMSEKWVNEFAEKYRAAGIRLPFYATCHPRTTTKEMLITLTEVGLDEPCVGIQTGSPRVMSEIYERRTTNEDVLRMAEWFREIGFGRVQYDLVSNTPYEDEEDCLATLDLLARLPKPFDLFIYQLVSFPTCKMERMGHRKGDMDEEGFFFYNMLYLLTQKGNLSEEAVKTLTRDEYLRKNPKVMSGLAAGILGEEQRVREMGWAIRDLEFRLNHLSLRELIKERAKRRLPAPIWNTLRAAKRTVKKATGSESSKAAAM